MTSAAVVLAAALHPGGIIAWIVIGLVAGALADWAIPGKGFGILGNMLVGLIGAFVGGLLVDLLVPNAIYGFWGSLVVSFLGACLVFFIVWQVRKHRTV